MKKLVLFLSLVLFSILSSAQTVCVIQNVNTINRQMKMMNTVPVTEQGGCVYIYKSMCRIKSTGGLLIYHHVFMDEYYAYERYCPECLAHGIKSLIVIQNLKCPLIARCNHCGSIFQNISQGSGQQTNRSGKYWLKTYPVEQVGNKLIISMPQF